MSGLPVPRLLSSGPRRPDTRPSSHRKTPGRPSSPLPEAPGAGPPGTAAESPLPASQRDVLLGAQTLRHSPCPAPPTADATSSPRTRTLAAGRGGVGGVPLGPPGCGLLRPRVLPGQLPRDSQPHTHWAVSETQVIPRVTRSGLVGRWDRRVCAGRVGAARRGQGSRVPARSSVTVLCSPSLQTVRASGGRGCTGRRESTGFGAP